MSTSTPGRLTRDELIARIESGDVDTVILAITDMQGRLQGKRVDASFFVDDLIDRRRRRAAATCSPPTST